MSAQKTPPSTPPAVSEIAKFQSLRLAATENGAKFIDYSLLIKLVRQHFGRQTPREVAAAVAGVQRMLQEVNSTISAAIATHHLLPLHELSSLILSTNTNFEGLESFDALLIGPLRGHPTVQLHFPPVALGPVAPASVNGLDVMAFIAVGAQPQSQPATHWPLRSCWPS